MRFKVSTAKETKSDDQQLLSWNIQTGGISKKQSGSELFALAASDGRLHLVSKNGRIERSIEAHQGAVLGARWSQDGSALASGGEDGQIKIWSRNGMLRSTLLQSGKPVYCIAWSSDSSKILYTFGKTLVIKSLQPSNKPLQWLAHDGLVLKVCWNPNNNLIISGSEDCRYKIWDSYGRQLFASPVQDHTITSVSWTPDGEVFAVGSFNTLRLCDKAGWSHCLEKPDVGSIYSLSWSGDGTQLGAACGNGDIIFAHIVERRLEWKNYEAEVTGRKMIVVRNVLDDSFEKLEMKSRVLKVSLAHGFLIVIASTQCLIYSIRNWNTPVIFDLKEGSVRCIVQAEKHFLLVDGSTVCVYSYEGKFLCSPRWAGMRPDLLNTSIISLSNVTLAIRDQNDEKVVHLFDALSGKTLHDGKSLSHKYDIVTIALDQRGSSSEQYLAFIDRNSDLHLSAVRLLRGPEKAPTKLAVMVQSICWNDSSIMLAALLEGKLCIWYYPQAIFIDRAVSIKACCEKDASDYGKNPELVSFLGNQICIRRADGSLVSSTISPFPSSLYQSVTTSRWDDSIRMCRIVKDEALWACLAAMAIHAKQPYAAEVAYAALGEADKVEFLQNVSKITSKEVQLSEMALIGNNVYEAEAILLQGGLIFNAIMLNINLCKWDRALDLAVKHKIHMETVLAHRDQYLTRLETTESKPKFKELSNQIQWNWDNVKQRTMEEYAKLGLH